VVGVAAFVFKRQQQPRQQQQQQDGRDVRGGVGGLQKARANNARANNARANNARANNGGDAVYGLYAQIDDTVVVKQQQQQQQQRQQQDYTYEVPQSSGTPSTTYATAADTVVVVADPLYMFGSTNVSSTGHEVGSMTFSQPAANPLLLQSSYEAASAGSVVEDALYAHAHAAGAVAEDGQVYTNGAGQKTDYTLAAAADVAVDVAVAVAGKREMESGGSRRGSRGRSLSQSVRMTSRIERSFRLVR